MLIAPRKDFNRLLVVTGNILAMPRTQAIGREADFDVDQRLVLRIESSREVPRLNLGGVRIKHHLSCSSDRLSLSVLSTLAAI
ncbi:MAG: hypothetical protein U0930_05680 [Pirellulales bacterium]